MDFSLTKPTEENSPSFEPKLTYSTYLQSMTCDVQLHLRKLRSAVASCDVCAGLILVVTCDVRACLAFSGLQSVTAISHIFLEIMKEMKIEICFLLASVTNLSKF